MSNINILGLYSKPNNNSPHMAKLTTNGSMVVVAWLKKGGSLATW